MKGLFASNVVKYIPRHVFTGKQSKMPVDLIAEQLKLTAIREQ